MKIVDDKFTTLTNDIDKLQKSPTLYVSYRGAAGVAQLVYEMTNNMIDEHINPNTLSDGKMLITLDGVTGMCFFKDTGRGINFDDLENACTILQAGSKMDREYGGGSGGEYGVGLTATNALSEEFCITSTRQGKSRYLRFLNGRKVNDVVSDLPDTSIHGLTVGFRPSKAFLGEDTYFPIEDIKGWLNRIVHVLGSDIEITFVVTDESGNEISRDVYHNEEGTIAGFLPSIVGDIGYLTQNPVFLQNKMELLETNIPVKMENADGTSYIGMTEQERYIRIGVAFNYSPNVTEPLVYGFTNVIEQPDGGVHVNAMKTAISNLLYAKIQDVLKKSEYASIIPEDVLTGLVAVISLDTTMTTGFESQTKHKLSNKKFINPIKNMVTKSLSDYLDTPEGKTFLKKVGSFISLNAKIRLDATNKRKKVKTSAPTVMGSKSIEDYVPANLIGTPKAELEVPLEVYFGEGASAGGQLRKARFNPDYQGILSFTGNPDNVYDKFRSQTNVVLPPDNVFAIIHDKVLGCGYGKHFDIDKLLYDKIIYSFDADVDGAHMAGLTLSGMWRLAPDLILQGHCYRVITPLYKIAESYTIANKMNKKDPDPNDYVYSKSELYDWFEDNACKYTRLKFTTTDDFISNANMKRFLRTNREYYEVLDLVSEYESVPKDVIEFIAGNPDYEDHIKELDEELNIVEGSVVGCYKKTFVSVPLTTSFLDNIKFLRKVIQQGNDGIYRYEFYDRGKDKGTFRYVDNMTIGQIMEFCQKFSPYIVNRYKGLGEMSKYEMYKLVMHPSYRRLVRYTVSDVERFEQTLDEMFLSAKKYRQIRKNLVQTMNVSLDDIDN